MVGSTRHLLIFGGCLLAAALALTLWRQFSPEPAANAYASKTKADIIKEWGPLAHEWDGHYGGPPLHFVEQFGPAKTLVFKRWSGSLYVSLHEVDGEWVCFCSSWLPRGGVF